MSTPLIVTTAWAAGSEKNLFRHFSGTIRGKFSEIYERTRPSFLLDTGGICRTQNIQGKFEKKDMCRIPLPEYNGLRFLFPEYVSYSPSSGSANSGKKLFFGLQAEPRLPDFNSFKSGFKHESTSWFPEFKFIDSPSSRVQTCDSPSLVPLVRFMLYT